MRIGLGYDVHRLVEERDLIIGGVKIPYEKGLLGHSDADVLLHAIIDSLLGASALGDIGTLFPDTDIKYKGISSINLLKEVGKLLNENGYSINNIDSTIIAQKPKMAPYIKEMRENIAKAKCEIVKYQRGKTFIAHDDEIIKNTVDFNGEKKLVKIYG